MLRYSAFPNSEKEMHKVNLNFTMFCNLNQISKKLSFCIWTNMEWYLQIFLVWQYYDVIINIYVQLLWGIIIQKISYSYRSTWWFFHFDCTKIEDKCDVYPNHSLKKNPLQPTIQDPQGILRNFCWWKSVWNTLFL